MKYIIVIISTLILLGNQKTFSQTTCIRGTMIDYRSGCEVQFVTLNYPYNGGGIGTIADTKGNFELELEGDTGYLFIGCPTYYPIKIFNIPREIKQIDFGEIKMVHNYLTENIVVGGYSPEVSENQIEQDNELRKDVLQKYRVKVNGKKLKPYFHGSYKHTQYIVFDFNKNDKK